LGSVDIQFWKEMQWFIGSVKMFAHTLLPSSDQNLNSTWAWIIHYGLSLAFQRWWYKKNTKERLFFSLYYLLPDLLFPYIPFTFPHTSKCFLSYSTKNMHILASGPELQAGRFGYVILGENQGGSLRGFKLMLFPCYFNNNQSMWWRWINVENWLNLQKVINVKHKIQYFFHPTFNLNPMSLWHFLLISTFNSR
jgi:hypothetical protein